MMSMPDIRAWINDVADDRDYEVIIMDGWDQEIVGICRTLDGQTHVVYDEDAIIASLIASGDGTPEECREYFDYNIAGLSPMDGGPLFIERPPIFTVSVEKRPRMTS